MTAFKKTHNFSNVFHWISQCTPFALRKQIALTREFLWCSFLECLNSTTSVICWQRRIPASGITGKAAVSHLSYCTANIKQTHLSKLMRVVVCKSFRAEQEMSWTVITLLSPRRDNVFISMKIFYELCPKFTSFFFVQQTEWCTKRWIRKIVILAAYTLASDSS